MDINKVSEQTILYAVAAIMVVVVAIAVRLVCIRGGLDVGTANLVFLVVLGIGTVLYILLIKGLTSLIYNLLAKRNAKKARLAETSVPSEESVHDRIVREKFEENIAIFRNYTGKIVGKQISLDELKRLDGYIERYAREQPLGKVQPIRVPPHKISNNDLYHYGWNLWNHFRANRTDKRQECIVEWLKEVFVNLDNIESSTIKGKLTIHDPKGDIALHKSIPDFLRFLKE